MTRINTSVVGLLVLGLVGGGAAQVVADSAANGTMSGAAGNAIVAGGDGDEGYIIGDHSWLAKPTVISGDAGIECRSAPKRAADVSEFPAKWLAHAVRRRGATTVATSYWSPLVPRTGSRGQRRLPAFPPVNLIYLITC